MIKFICDFCYKEIQENEEVSKYIHLEIKYLPDGKMSKAPKEEIFCSECTEKIKEAIEKLKK